MKDRILEFLKSENKSSAQLAEEIGVQASGISHILSGRNKPSLDFVTKMLEKYSFLSTEWLLFGRGKMYKDQLMQDLFDETANIIKRPDLSERSERQIDKTPDTSLPKESSGSRGRSDLERIVMFYTDKTFSEYFPGVETDKK